MKRPAKEHAAGLVGFVLASVVGAGAVLTAGAFGAGPTVEPISAGSQAGPVNQGSDSLSEPAANDSVTPARDYEAEIYPIVAAEVTHRCHIELPIGTYVFSTATTDKSIVYGWQCDQFHYQLDRIPPDLIAGFQDLMAFDVPQGDLRRIWPNVEMLEPGEMGKYYFWHGPAWKEFRRKHPRPQGIWMFSRVGVSRDGKWAMMYVVSRSGNCEDGVIYVLRQDAEVWEIDRTIPVWVA